MDNKIVFSFFSEEEEAGHSKFRTLRDKHFRPLVAFCKRYSIHPDLLSYLGLLMVVPFFFFFNFNPWISLIFLGLNIFLDALDGPVARASNKVGVAGTVTDFVCDHASFLAIYLVFVFFGLLNPFWSCFYILNYVILLILVVVERNLKIKFFPVIRSKYIFYLMFVFWLITGLNYFDTFLVLFGIYMFITNLFLFQKFRWYLKQ